MLPTAVANCGDVDPSTIVAPVMILPSSAMALQPRPSIALYPEYPKLRRTVKSHFARDGWGETR